MFHNTIRKLAMERLNQRIADAETEFVAGKKALKVKLKEDTATLAEKLVQKIFTF